MPPSSLGGRNLAELEAATARLRCGLALEPTEKEVLKKRMSVIYQ